MKKYAYLLPISISLTLPMSALDNPMDNYQQNFMQSIGAYSKVDLAKQGEAKDGKGQGALEDSYMDTVIYNDIHSRQSHRGQSRMQNGVQEFAADGIKLAKPHTDHIAYTSERYAQMEKDRLEKEKQDELAKQEKPKYFVGGYCIATKRTEILKSSSFSSFDCELEFGDGQYREVQVFGGIYPNYEKEILVSLPIYATLPNGKRVSMSGVIMNVDKTSLNIANEVESYRIRRWVAKYGLTFNNVAYRYATMYMEDLRASRRSMETTYLTTTIDGSGVTTTTPVQNINTAPPSASETFALAGVELFSRLMAVGAENLLENTAPLFTVYEGQRVWVEGVIDTDTEKSYGTLKEMDQTIKDEIRNENQQFMRVDNINAVNGAVGTSAITSTIR